MENSTGILITARAILAQVAAGREQLIEESAVLLEEMGHWAEDLAVERDRLHALVGSIVDEVWFCDAEGNLTAMNQAALQGPGLAPTERHPDSPPEPQSGPEATACSARERTWQAAPVLRSLRGETLKDVEQAALDPRTGRIRYGLVSSAPVSRDGDVVGAVAVIRDVTEPVRLREDLRSLTLVDELTGLYNRRGFMTLAEQQMKLAQRTGSELSILMADQDGLKGINDTFGHNEGDLALATIATTLRQTCRKSDVVARLGGDEFAVLAARTSKRAAASLHRRLQQAIDALNASGRFPYELSLSLGIACYDAGCPCSLEELLERADADMYRKKRGKRRP